MDLAAMPGKEPPMRNTDEKPDERPPTPDDDMTQKEKEDFETQVEEFEGPDRREIRGDHENPPHEPGVSRS